MLSYTLCFVHCSTYLCDNVLIHGRDGLGKRPRRVRRLQSEGSAHDQQRDGDALFGARGKVKYSTVQYSTVMQAATEEKSVSSITVVGLMLLTLFVINTVCY